MVSCSHSHWCVPVIFVESESQALRVRVIQSFFEFSHDLVELNQKNCRVTWSHWFASLSQCPVKWNLTFFRGPFLLKRCPTGYKMVPDTVLAILIPNHLDISFFAKEISILLLAFTLSHFHKSNLNLLHEIYPLVFRMPTKMTRDEHGFGIEFCRIILYW